MEKRKGTFFAIYFAYFLDYFGYAIVFGIFGPLMLDPEFGMFSPETSLRNRNIALGILFAIYPLVQLLTAPLFGDIADHFGRKRTFYILNIGAMTIFRGKELYVIGGGDTAVEEAIFLTKYGSKVYIVHRRDTLRASKIMARHAMENAKIEILWNHVLKSVEGDQIVTGVTLENLKTQKEVKREAAGVFFAIGHNPNTVFLSGQLETDPQGYLLVKPGTTLTKIPGVFAAGDVQDKVYRQAVSAAGSGCMAALDAERFLSTQGF